MRRPKQSFKQEWAGRNESRNFGYNMDFTDRRKNIMNILPYQTEIAERMLVGTEGETFHPDAQFVQTANGYWIAWHEGNAALLAPDTPPDIPCFWAEGAQSLEELVELVENGEFDEMEEFDGDDDAWHEHAAGCDGGHDGHCGCSHS